MPPIDPESMRVARPLGNVRITNMEEDIVVDMFSNHLKIRYSISKSFRRRTESLLERSPIPSEKLEWFIDACKCEDGSGAGPRGGAITLGEICVLTVKRHHVVPIRSYCNPTVSST